ncbi:MAG: S-layer homology domain-containing protein [Akkermansiaceae bacterium]|nr:S-layer homology domain-containing protein [Armatimonadota bacterium]
MNINPLILPVAFAAAAALSALPARAQAPFSDVPADHWAYAAVEKLRNAGIIEGYPDKSYGGARPMTRYEFAIAVERLLDGQRTVELRDEATRADVKSLRDELGAKFATKEEVEALRRRLTDGLRPELGRQGQAVRSLRDRMIGLSAPLPPSKPR